MLRWPSMLTLQVGSLVPSCFATPKLTRNDLRQSGPPPPWRLTTEVGLKFLVNWSDGWKTRAAPVTMYIERWKRARLRNND
jgi:hypothetical protein